MATRSTISILNTDGSVEGVYCHWDGYLSNNGKILKTAYDTQRKVRDLISLGDMSVLNFALDECVFYHRDRQEDWDSVAPRVANSLETLPLGEEYNYVFDVSKNEWLLNWNGELISFEPHDDFMEELEDY